MNAPAAAAPLFITLFARLTTLPGEARSEGANELVMKERSETEAAVCELKIQLTPNGAKVEQSKDCDNFSPGICHFSTDGKEMVKIK